MERTRVKLISNEIALQENIAQYPHCFVGGKNPIGIETRNKLIGKTKYLVKWTGGGEYVYNVETKKEIYTQMATYINHDYYLGNEEQDEE
jgi:hypothetical protein